MGAYSNGGLFAKMIFRWGLIQRGGAYSSVGSYLRIYGIKFDLYTYI